MAHSIPFPRRSRPALPRWRQVLPVPTAALLSAALWFGTALRVLAQPTITSVSPARNLRNAPPNSAFVATFDQNMSSGSASAALRVYSAQAGGRKAGTAYGSGNALGFNPTTPFKPGEVVMATITQAATSTGGQPLARPQVVQFTAAAGVGTGIFNNGTDVPAGGAPQRLAMADIDGDGDLDLLTANYDDNAVAIRLNNGSGVFGGTASVPVDTEPGDVATADVDGDGDLDLLTSNLFAQTVSLRLNDGFGSFSSAGELNMGVFPIGVTMADVNGDGAPDLVVTNLHSTMTPGTVSVRLNTNDGTGTFGSLTSVVVGRDALGAETADVDNDGDLDLLIPNADANKLHVRLNDGSGTFSNAPDVTVGSQPVSVAVADLDGDGDLDLVTANAFSHDLSIRRNDGTGAFSNTATLSMGTVDVRRVVTGDVDGDGDLDLLTANGFDNTVSVYLNDGSAGFGSAAVASVGQFANDLAVADLDSDGDLDVVTVAAYVANTAAVRFNGEPNLLITTLNQAILPGTYGNVTIAGTGSAYLNGDVTVSGALVVQTGGALYDGCHLISGPGTFTLEAGAELTICHPTGISQTGPTGMVQVTGGRSFSDDATYTYAPGLGNQTTGTGLPAQVRALNAVSVFNVTLLNPVAVRRSVDISNSGHLISDGKLMLLSDATATAQVNNLNDGVVMGAATAQRYLDPSANPGVGYRHFSAPTTNSAISDLSATGFTARVNPVYNTAPATLTAATFPNVFGFDEARLPASLTFTDGYYSPNALTDNLAPGRGYTVAMAGTVKTDFTGTFTNGPVPLTLTRTGTGTGNLDKTGWSLMGNPYPSPLDWDVIPNSDFPANMSQSVSVFKSTGLNDGVYLTRVNGMGTLPNGEIAMAQGVFVRLTSGTTAEFTFRNAYRITSTTNPSHFRAAPEPRPTVGLTLQSTAPGAVADEALVYVQTGATAGLDNAFDAAKPGHNLGAVPTLVSLTGAGDELAINGLPETALAAGQAIELLLDVPAAGTYTLNLSRLLNLDGQTVSLFDGLTNITTPLTLGQPYTFTAPTAGALRRRFWLNLNAGRVTGLDAQPAAGSSPLALYPNPARGTAHLTGTLPNARLTLLDALGRPVRALSATATGTAALDLQGLPAGLYTVRAGTATTRLVVE